MAESFFDEPKPKRNLLPFIGIGALVLILVAVGYWFFEIREKKVVLEGREVSFSQEGKLVSSFPEEFILDKDAEIQSSYAVDYSKGDQPAAIYLTKKSFAEMYDAYKQSLSQNGWNIVAQSGNSAEVGMIYAERGGYKEEVNVTFEKVSDGTKVIIGIMRKDAIPVTNEE